MFLGEEKCISGIKNNVILELLLWRNRIGSVVGTLGPGFDPGPAPWVKDP